MSFSIQVNIRKIIYLNCGEINEDVIDHRSYAHSLGRRCLPLFSCLIAIFISSLVSVPLSISRSWAAGKMSVGFVEVAC